MTGMMELVDKDLKTATVNKFKDLKENMKTGKKEMEDCFKKLKNTISEMTISPDGLPAD